MTETLLGEGTVPCRNYRLGRDPKGRNPMRTTQSKGSYSTYRDGVATLMEAGEPFGDVEEAIERTDLEQDEKAALWLFAFSSRDHLTGVAD